MDPLTFDLATDVLTALETSNWFYLASLTLALTTLFLRPRVAKTVPFFKTDRGGVAFVVLLGTAGGVLHGVAVVVAQFVSGMPVVNSFTSAWGATVAKVVGGSIATYAAVKKLGLWPESRVQTVEDAIRKAEQAANTGVEMTTAPESEVKNETQNHVADKSGGGAA